MITLDYKDKQLVLTGDVLDRSVVKTIGAVKASGSKRWTLPAALPTLLEAQYVVKRDGGIVTEAALTWAGFTYAAMASLRDLKTLFRPSTSLGSVTLRPDQETDAQYMATVGNGMILHPMRLGKTFQLLRVLDLLDKWPVLIAVKPRTILGFEKQVRMAFPERTVAVLKSGMTATQRKKVIAEGADIVLCGHNLLELHSKILGYGGLTTKQRDAEREKGKYDDKEFQDYGFRVVVVDEAHNAKSPTTAVTRACWALGDEAEHRFALTGTPAPNREDEWWPTLRFCWPNIFPSRRAWTNRYIEYQDNFAGYPECRGWKPETKEMWDTIFDVLHVRRERTSGPTQEVRVIPVEMEKGQAKLYKELADHGMTFLGDEMVDATDTITLRHRLVQLASGTPVVAGGNIVKLTAPSSKIDALLEVLSEDDEQAIVVCESRLLADLVIHTLREKDISTVSIIGGMSVGASTESERLFQEGSARVLVMTKSGAEGIELSKAKRTIFLQVSEDLTFMWQAENRNTSDAQEAISVELVYIYAKGTIDEAMQEAYVRKDAALHKNLKDVNWIKRNMFGDANA